MEAKLPYPHVDSQAGNEYCGWQILVAAIDATKSFDDAKLADWLDKNSVDTLAGKRDFKGLNHTSSTDNQEIRQVQNARWCRFIRKKTRRPASSFWPPEPRQGPVDARGF